MNTIIPIAIIFIIVVLVAVLFIGGIYISAKEDAELDRIAQVNWEVQECLDKKYKEDYAKCRTQEDYDKLERAVEKGEYSAVPIPVVYSI